jgi:hypothetical protein
MIDIYPLLISSLGTHLAPQLDSWLQTNELQGSEHVSCGDSIRSRCYLMQNLGRVFSICRSLLWSYGRTNMFDRTLHRLLLKIRDHLDRQEKSWWALIISRKYRHSEKMFHYSPFSCPHVS